MYQKLLLLGMLGTLMYAHDSIKVELIQSQDLQKERELFLDYWAKESQSFNQKLYDVADEDALIIELSKWPLGLIFDQEEQAYQNNEGDRIFIHVIQGDKIVGYMSCFVGLDGILYIREFALSEFRQKQLFQNMLMFAVDTVPGTMKIGMMLHKVKLNMNIVQQLELEQLGFEHVEGQVEGFDPKKYSYFEMVFVKRHMTAWLDDMTMCSWCGCGQSCDCPEGACSCGEASIGIGAACGCGSEDVDYLEADVISVVGKLCDYPEEDESVV